MNDDKKKTINKKNLRKKVRLKSAFRILSFILILLLLNISFPLEVFAKSYKVNTAIYVNKKNNVTLYKVHDKNKFGVLTKSGDIIVPVEYSKIEASGGFLFAEKDGKIICYNLDGSVFAPLKYDKILPDYNFFPVEYNNKWGLIDKAGKVIIPVEYTSFYNGPVFENKYLFQKEGEIIFFHKGKKFIFPKNIEKASVGLLAKNLFIVEQNQKKGLYDTQNNKITIPVIYDDINCINIYRIIAKKDNRYKLLRPDGSEILKDTFKDIKINNAFIAVKKDNDLYDVYCRTENLDKILTNKDFIDINMFSLDRYTLLIKVKQNGLWGLEEYNIETKKIKNILPYIYNEIIIYNAAFGIKYCLAKINDKWASYNILTGEKATEFDDDYIEHYFAGEYILKLDGKKVVYTIDNFNKYKYYTKPKKGAYLSETIVYAVIRGFFWLFDKCSKDDSFPDKIKVKK